MLKNLSTPLVVSVIIGLLVILWVKMTLNRFAEAMDLRQDAGAQQQPDAKEAALDAEPEAPYDTNSQPAAYSQDSQRPASGGRDSQRPASGGRDSQPAPVRAPPAQPRSPIPWTSGNPPPMPLGATLIHVDPDPVGSDDDRAFDNAE